MTESIKIVEMVIDIDMACELLEKNTHNRALTQSLIDKYADAMRRGEWDLNGESIKISKSQVILDGQHRLWAIIKSGKPLRTFLMTGLEDKVFDTIDQGKSRTAGDVLSVKGEKNYNALASAARLLMLYKQYGNPFFAKGGKGHVTPRQIEQIVDTFPDLRDSVSTIIGDKRLRVLLTASLGSFAHYIFTHDNPVIAESFFQQLSSGVNLSEGSPIGLLRDRLMSNLASRVNMTKQYRGALLFKAYRKYRDGQSLRVLKVLDKITIDDYKLGGC